MNLNLFQRLFNQYAPSRYFIVPEAYLEIFVPPKQFRQGLRIVARNRRASRGDNFLLVMALDNLPALVRLGEDVFPAGHLNWLARAIQEEARHSDLIGYVDANRVGCIAGIAEKVDALELGGRFQKQVLNAAAALTLPRPLSVSVAVSTHRAGESMRCWLSRTLAALEKAQTEGGNRVALADGPAR